MRLSDWLIIWNPLSTTPQVLLDYDDLMEEETSRSLEQVIDMGRLDFSTRLGIASRGNVRRRLEFSRRMEHATAGESWAACQEALARAPWGVKSLLQIIPRGGTGRLLTAAMLASSHTQDTSGALPESVHRYTLRIAPQEMEDAGDGISVIGGVFNPPNNILIILPDGEGGEIAPGDTVEVVGVPGIQNGYYPVTGNDGSGLHLGNNNSKSAKENTPALPNFEIDTDWAESPLNDIYGAKLRRQVILQADSACEAWNGHAWIAVNAGDSVSLWHSQDYLYYQGDGSWSGLYTLDPFINYSPQQVRFTPRFGMAKFRRIGSGSYINVPVPIAATATATYKSSTGSVHYLDLPEIHVRLLATGDYVPPGGSIPGEGSVKKKRPKA